MARSCGRTAGLGRVREDVRLCSRVANPNNVLLFRVTCVGNSCKIFRAPPLDEIEDKIYNFDDKCYKMESNATTCDSKKKIYDFA